MADSIVLFILCLFGSCFHRCLIGALWSFQGLCLSWLPWRWKFHKSISTRCHQIWQSFRGLWSKYW